MKYQTKIKIAGKELTSLTSDRSYIRDVELSDCVSNKVLDIGATGASSLSLTIVNPESASYDGEDVEFYVSPIDDGIKSRAEQIVDEVGETAGTDVIFSDSIEVDGTEDAGDEGEPMSASEEAQLEAEIEAENKSAYEILEGTSETVETETTAGEEEAEWTKLGLFTVYSQNDSNGQIRLICYDKFALMNDIYTPSVKRGTVQTLFNDYCTQLRTKGIEIDSEIEMPETQIAWVINVSYREAIGYFAGLCGGYADFDEDGVLTINQYAPSGVELVKEELISITGTSGGDVDVTGFECGGLVAGDIASMSFSNPFMTQAILDDIYSDYKGLRLSGQKFTAMWNPAMQAGTFVRLMSEEEYRAYLKLKNYAEQNGATPEIIADINSIGNIVQITSQTVTFNGDAITQINSALSTTTATENPSVEPVKTLATTAREMADSATQSASVALTKAEEATESAGVALTKANEASTSADTALTKANEASTSAANAKASADTAHEQAKNATQSATNAGVAAANAQAAAKAAQGDIDMQKTYFWHDEEGAHILAAKQELRADIKPDGLHILSLTDSIELASFTKEGVHIQDTFGEQLAHFGWGPITDEEGRSYYRRWVTLGLRSSDSAIGDNSVAEGFNVKAIGDFSHAEGLMTSAEGENAHAEGRMTKARGNTSHAEGLMTETDGENAHAEGYWTYAAGDNQHVEGRFNIKDIENKYVHIIGNGTNIVDRSNAFTVDWDGNIEAAGTIKDGDGNTLDSKQDKLTAGNNISIDNNVISATFTPTIPSGAFVIKEYKKDNISIAGSGDSENTINISLAGYTPISSLGFRVMNASSSGVGSSYANIYRADIVPASNQYVVYARNIRTSAIKVAVNVRVLYIKSEFISL